MDTVDIKILYELRKIPEHQSPYVQLLGSMQDFGPSYEVRFPPKNKVPASTVWQG